MKRPGLLLLLFLFGVQLHAAVHVWTGAASDRFSDAGNWAGGSPAGDANAELSFPGGVSRLAVINDLTGLTVRSIAFSGAGYVVSGNAITLVADAEVTDRPGPNELATDLVVTSGAAITVWRDFLGGGGGLRISGAIRGTGPLTKLGDGLLTLAGTQANTYAGATRVLDGGLTLTKNNGVTSVPGDLLISSTGANDDFGAVATLTSEQIADSGSIRITNSSDLRIGGVETIGPVSMQGNAKLWTGISFGNFTSTVGTAILTGDITATGPASLSLLGDFALSGTPTITAACDCDLEISGVREHTPGAGLILRGPESLSNTMRVNGVYRGPTIIESGRVILNNPNTAVRLRGGVLSGSVGSLLSERGTIGPLTTVGDLRLNGATTVLLAVRSFAPAISAGGVVDITRARLQFELDDNLRRDLGATYVSVRNTGSGPIIGRFAGVDEGDILFKRYRISYRGGDGSNDITFTDIGAFSTQTSLNVQAFDPKEGDTVTLVATVRSFETSPQLVGTGQITFREGSTVLATRPVSNGVAILELQPTWGRHQYTATYEGNATFLPSSSSVASVHIDAPPPTITSLDPTSIDTGGTATITVRGTGFRPGGTIRAGVTQLPTTFVSSTEVRFTVTIPVSSSTELHIRYDLGEVFSNVLLLKINHPPPAPTSPIVFDAKSVRGPVTPGGNAAWLSVGNALRGGSFVTQAAAAVTADPDRDGTTVWEPTFPLSQRGLAVLVDMTDRKITAGRLGGSTPAPLAFPRAMFLRDSAGNYTHVLIDKPGDWNVLWVRPGVGAWYFESDEGSQTDLDRTANGILVFNTASMFAVPGVTAPPPAGILPGDVFVGIDWDYNSWFGDVVDTHLGESDGPGSVRFADAPNIVRTVGEGVGVATFRVMRVGGSDGTVTVDYTTMDDTAIGGIQYSPVAGRLTFGPGEILRTFDVTLLNDSIYSGDTKFRVALSNPAGTSVIGPGAVTVNVREDDPRPVLSVQSFTVTEGDDGERTVQWTATISGATRVPVSGRWGWRESVDSETIVGGPFTFVPGGPTSQTFTARYTANRIPEPDRLLLVSLTDVVNASPASGTITITDDDFASLTILDATVSETRESVQVIVSADTASRKPITVQYATANGSATAGSDYTTRTGSVTFDVTSTIRTITIPIVSDAATEGNETFTVTLSAPSNARLRNDTATVTIVDDESGTLPTLTVAPVLVDESLSDNAAFVVSLSYPVATEVRVQATAVNGTAVAGQDFQTTNRTVTILPGETRAFVLVPIVNDNTPEPQETFTIQLSGAVGATIHTASATATIYDRDLGPAELPIAVSVVATSVPEGNAGTTVARFTVRLSRASTTPFNVQWATADGSAVAGSDFVAASGTLTFAPGETERTVDVAVRGDTAYEIDETFSVVAGPSGFANARIVNDDQPPVRRRSSGE
jgi:autotransporter-associated beta strand protein